MTDRVRWVGVLGLLTLLFTAPYLGLPVHLQSLLYVLFFWVTLATSWNMLSGYSGYFSFGHGAFFGVSGPEERPDAARVHDGGKFGEVHRGKAV
mgnify:CR=1 FL=1